MEKPLVSIIIPFYNDEKHLERAILSAVNQTYESLEIILINDGSSDNSVEIAQELIDKSPILSLFTIENSGLSIARNFGVGKSKGEYISFLDSDDEFEIDAIDNFVQTIQKTNSEIVASKFYLKNEKAELLNIGGWKSKEIIISSTKAITKMYSNEITFTAWAKLYKSSIIKSISFPEGLWFEDRPFFFESLLNSKSISFIDKPLLSIYTTSESITRRLISEKRIVDLQKIFVIELELAAKNQTSIELQNLICSNHINVLYETAIILSLEKKKLGNFSELLNSFNESITKTKILMDKIPLSLKRKTNLSFKLLLLNKKLGWQLFEPILKTLKKSHFTRIKILKQL
ncbi:glycosyltransferase [bacterium]|nr:glycosyltransferase [bacterium]MDB4089343.1 glycosyltransferase [Flavobacteriales bacterium]